MGLTIFQRNSTLIYILNLEVAILVQMRFHLRAEKENKNYLVTT